jgi:hypothetical protein
MQDPYVSRQPGRGAEEGLSGAPASATKDAARPSLAANARQLLLVSCRYCLRPIMLAGRITDSELAELGQHLRTCGPREPSAERPGVDEVLRHFRVGGDHG